MKVTEQVSVLSVDDDSDLLKLSAAFLERKRNGVKVITAINVSDALGPLSWHDIDFLDSDFEMPSMDGIELLHEIRLLDCNLPFILLTGKSSEEITSDAISAWVTNYLQKPWAEMFSLLATRSPTALQSIEPNTSISS